MLRGRISLLTGAVYLFDEFKIHNEKLFAPYTEVKQLTSSPSPQKTKRPNCGSNVFGLEWRDAFRTFDWVGIYPDPEYHLGQIDRLIALAR